MFQALLVVLPTFAIENVWEYYCVIFKGIDSFVIGSNTFNYCNRVAGCPIWLLHKNQRPALLISKNSSYQRYVDLKRISCDAEVKVHWKSIIVKNCLEIV